ncbi:MAG: hypothetical protein WD928_15310, partial [Gammaproteobacteria bacterium]
FTDPMTPAVALDKSAAKRLVRDAGVATAPFVVVAPGAPLPALPFPFPVFAKPLAEGTGKGCEVSSLCHDVSALAATVSALGTRFAQAVIVEPFLSGREFTVGLVDAAHGVEVVGILEIVLNAGADAGVYSYRNKEDCETLVTYQAADDEAALAAAACAIAAYRALDCRDCARIDIRCDAAGEPFFLEANPLAGMHPEHSDLPIAAALAGRSYDWLVGAIVSAAARRYGLDRPPHRSSSPRKRSFVPVVHAASAERADERDTVEAAERVAAALERIGHASELVSFRPHDGMLEALVKRQPTAVFNLVEAIDGDGRAMVLAPWAFDRHGLSYTGNGFAACLLTASKLATKGLLIAHGLSTPALIGTCDTDREVILKPVWEHASFGIDSASVVAASGRERALAARAARFGQAFFAEAFVPGREFNVALLGSAGVPQVLPIQETLFVDWPQARARVVDYEAKWVTTSAAYRSTPRRFGLEQREPVLARSLTTLAERVWQVCELRGYARVDFRVGDDGEPMVIDVNANPGLGPDAGFVAAAAAAAIDFDQLIARLVECTLRAQLAA